MKTINLDAATLHYAIKMLLKNKPPRGSLDEKLYYNGYVEAIQQVESLLEEGKETI